MEAIRDKMTADLDLRGFASATKEKYLQYAKIFVAYHRRSPTELGEADIREFLLHLIHEREVGAATQRIRACIPGGWSRIG